MDIVVKGISERMMQVLNTENLQAIEVSGGCHAYDVMFLLKQIVAPSEPDGDARREKIAHALICEKPKMYFAAEYLYKKRNQIAHMQPESSRLADLQAVYEAARQLLECFTPHSALALTELKWKRQYALAPSPCLGQGWGQATGWVQIQKVLQGSRRITRDQQFHLFLPPGGLLNLRSSMWSTIQPKICWKLWSVMLRSGTLNKTK